MQDEWDEGGVWRSRCGGLLVTVLLRALRLRRDKVAGEGSGDGGVECIYHVFFLGVFRFGFNGRGSVAVSAGGVQSW